MYNASNGKGIANLPRVLPVDVQPVELVVSEELDSFVHELVHPEHVGGQFLERGGAECPATDGEKYLESIHVR